MMTELDERTPEPLRYLTRIARLEQGESDRLQRLSFIETQNREQLERLVRVESTVSATGRRLTSIDSALADLGDQITRRPTLTAAVVEELTRLVEERIEAEAERKVRYAEWKKHAGKLFMGALVALLLAHATGAPGAALAFVKHALTF